MHCRNCGNQVDERAVACPKCGVNPRDGSAFCQSCGKPTDPNQVICRQCGVSLAKPAPVLASAHDPRASNKIAAGICGILLGAFGVHKFILGYTGAGLIMLLVTVLSCGIAGAVIHIIGLIEGIIYLTKSDEEFVRIYVVGRKEWF
jgi:TM2 domain-containing membrane protein YozV